MLLHTRPLSIDPAVQPDLLPLHVGRRSRATASSPTTTCPARPGHSSSRTSRSAFPRRRTAERRTRSGCGKGIRLLGRTRRQGRRLPPCDRARLPLRSTAARTSRGSSGRETCACASGRCDLSQGDRHRRDGPDRHLSGCARRTRSSCANLTVGGLATAVPANTPFRNTGFRRFPGQGRTRSRARASARSATSGTRSSTSGRTRLNPTETPTRSSCASGSRRSRRSTRSGTGAPTGARTASRPGCSLMLRTRFASQLRSFALPVTDFFQLNTTLAPFDDVRVRRALNFAIDRRDGRAHLRRARSGHADLPGSPSGRARLSRYCPYSLDPDGGTWRPDIGRADDSSPRRARAGRV